MKFSKETLKGAAEIIVLRELSELGEAYGYVLLRSIAASSNNIFNFSIGTLYPLLYRLEAKGYITSREKIAQNNKTRRYYKITTSGKKFLKAKTKEYKTFVEGMNTVLALE